jgi:hypothetical protein
MEQCTLPVEVQARIEDLNEQVTDAIGSIILQLSVWRRCETLHASCARFVERAF